MKKLGKNIFNGILIGLITGVTMHKRVSTRAKANLALIVTLAPQISMAFTLDCVPDSFKFTRGEVVQSEKCSSEFEILYCDKIRFVYESGDSSGFRIQLYQWSGQEGSAYEYVLTEQTVRKYSFTEKWVKGMEEDFHWSGGQLPPRDQLTFDRNELSFIWSQAYDRADLRTEIWINGQCSLVERAAPKI